MGLVLTVWLSRGRGRVPVQAGFLQHTGPGMKVSSDYLSYDSLRRNIDGDGLGAERKIMDLTARNDLLCFAGLCEERVFPSFSIRLSQVSS